MAGYFATAPFFYESAFVDVVAGWIAMTGGAILAASGTAAVVSGAVIRTAHGGFVVTQECIFTPLIPLYVAAALATPVGWRRRTAMLVATPAVFFALGVSRLLVLAVPAAVIGSYSVAIHAFSQTLVAVLLVAMAAFRTADGGQRAAARTAMAVALGAFAAFGAAPVLGAVVDGAVGGLQLLAGHGGHAFADEQGAWAILPAFQVGLFTALWLAVAGGGQSWRCALAGLSGLVAWCRLWSASRSTSWPTHYGFDPHVGLVRGWDPGASPGGGLVPLAVHRARAGSAPRAAPACADGRAGPQENGQEEACAAIADEGRASRPALASRSVGPPAPIGRRPRTVDLSATRAGAGPVAAGAFGTPGSARGSRPT